MPQICPKCSYIRKATDNCPDWQCPSCQVAYSKAGGTADASYGKYGSPVATRSPSSSGKLKLLLLLVALAAAIMAARPMLKARTPHHASDIATASTTQPQVVLYGTSWCGYCAAARKFFEENGIRYTELDVEKTTEGYTGHKKLGGGGVPVIVIGDQVLHGYSKDALSQSLAPWLKKS
ncbi:glutaredoxin family protein [Undibacterium sp.]|uniref:glutaredoxin family protein n=1 Tax=Undibacterium sp. TaxID=1914977 RepID=UPI002CDA2E89|nr:glutaredoxin family protein [Undibacterium sp.]HTD07113.1 glutaredoxin family protein [Undibacterium sp.]